MLRILSERVRGDKEGRKVGLVRKWRGVKEAPASEGDSLGA
jgi:hypothetical protein